MTSGKWKDSFLKSGFPLEFETARILGQHGFIIDPEFCYERLEAGQSKEFSVDIKATLYFPLNNPNKINAFLELLVECKYRAPNTTWVFLPEVNKPDFSTFTSGYTLRTINEFSFSQIPGEPIYRFEESAPYCYKGVEIDTSKGNAYDSEIRHGIYQLLYGLPPLISQLISVNIYEDAIPFFLLPILVTSAELRVLKKKTTLKIVEAINKLDEITEKVPYLFLFIPSFSQSFIDHARENFMQLADLDTAIGASENVREIEKRLRASGLKFYEDSLPSRLGASLAMGQIFELRKFCGQFMVCAVDSLPKVLNNIKQLLSSCLRKRKTF